MTDLNISGLDLNLLPPLDALLRQRNVTHAAEEVGLSQPAMSRALARLREIFGDEILVRVGRNFVLTPRAAGLAPRVAAALAEIRGLYKAPAFDPLAERRIVRIAAIDVQTVLFCGPLMARLRKEAPGVALRFEGYGADILARVESGATDLAFALTNTPLPPGVRSEFVASDRLALVMRRDHPAANRKWRIADYGRYDHVGVTVLGDGLSELDARLAAVGVTRSIPLMTPHFTAALAAVATSDLVTTISRAFARRFADAFGLAVLDPPFPNAELHGTIVWSAVKNGDKLLAWLRGRIGEVAREALAAEAV
jgi:DNA-binding transcriptional LysR family regulator